MNALSVALFVLGYPISILVIARWIPVVRERRMRWFVAHQLAVGCIVIGWGVRDRWSAVAVNGTWLIVAALWYLGRRGRPAGQSTPTLQA